MATEPAARTADGEQVEVYGEDLDEHDPEPEGGKRQPDDRKGAHDVVSDAVLAGRGQRRQGDGEDDGEDGSHRHQRGRLADAAADQRGGGHVVDVGLAEVAPHQLGQETAELHRQGAIEAPLAA